MPGLANRFDPHFFFGPRRSEGVCRCSFDVRVDKSVDLHHEWRDNHGPYRIGPTLRISGGRLSAAGRNLMAFPADTWAHVTITAGLGTKADGKWTLEVTLPGKETQVFKDLPVVSRDWKKLDWLGFCALGNTEAAFYLDNLKLDDVKDE